MEPVDPDPDLHTDFLVLSGTCLIPVDLAGDHLAVPCPGNHHWACSVTCRLTSQLDLDLRPALSKQACLRPGVCESPSDHSQVSPAHIDFRSIYRKLQKSIYRRYRNVKCC